MAHSGPPSTVPGAWRDSAISQLDAIAAANDAAVASARRRKLAWSIALGGAALWLASGSLSSPVRDAAPRQSRPPATAAQPAATRLAVHGTVTEAPARAPAVVTEAPAPPVAVAVTATAVDETTSRPRAALGAEARRKAAALAQERVRADEQAQRQQRLREQEAADHATALQQAQEARERAQAAEQAQRQVVLVAQNVPGARRGVREACSSSGGTLSQQFCHSRECRKPEHQDDMVCVRLHEIEVARLQYSVER